MKDCFRTHRYDKNQSLEDLSRNFGVPVCMILKANGLTGDKDIPDGAKIKMPYPCYCERDHNRYNKEEQNDMPCDECFYTPQALFFNYNVENNETIFNIAEKFCVTPHMIIRLNGLFKPDMITPGAQVKIPMVGFDTTIYKVKAGETLNDIAKKNELSEEIIKSLNFMKPNEYIYPSMCLILPKKETDF